MSSPPAWPQRVAILYEGQAGPGDLSQLFAQGFRSHHCDVDLLSRHEAWTRPYDFVLGYGPSNWEGTLLPSMEQMLSIASQERPFFYWWFIESVPNPAIPLTIVKLASNLRIALDRRIAHSPDSIARLRAARLDRFLLRGFRQKIVGELRAFQARGLLGGLAVTSHARAAYLSQLGFRSIVAPIGYHPSTFGTDLGLDRDIDVGFLGSINSKRRHRLMQSLTKQLESRGIQTSIQSHLYAEERTRFLNRSKIILNIFRAPHDFHGLRFMFCAANKALLVSEPLSDVRPFKPSVHLVAVPAEELAETIAFYLSNDQSRLQIVETAHQLIQNEYTIHQMVGRMLQHARELHVAARPTELRTAIS